MVLYELQQDLLPYNGKLWCRGDYNFLIMTGQMSDQVDG